MLLAMTASPLVSVVVPTFNRLSYLREAIAAVFAQTYGNWELIVVDDGSTDGTAEFLRGIKEERLRVVMMDHTGNPALLRNAGIRESRGEFIAFLDSDDRWKPEKLAAQLRGFAAEPECRWRYCGFERVDAAGHAMGPSRRTWTPERGWVLERLLRLEAVVPTPTVMVERALFDEAGGFDESFPHVEDYELWFRLATRSPVGVDAEPLAVVGVSSGTHSSDRHAMNLAWARVYRETAARVSPEQARLCRAKEAEHISLAARIEAFRGEPVRALRRLGRMAGQGWRSAIWWRALATAAFRTAVRSEKAAGHREARSAPAVGP
jgi:glycosyltransferase involved in cell wall biosynthesis